MLFVAILALACALAAMAAARALRAVPSTAGAPSGSRAAVRPAPVLLVALLASCLIAGAAPPAQADEAGSRQAPNLYAHFLNVGQGDSEFLWLPDGSTMLVDAGTSEAGPAVVSWLEYMGVTRIDYVVATHPHEDHIGGMPAVLGAFEVGEVIAPMAEHDTATYEAFIDAVAAKGLTITPAEAGLRVYDALGCAVDVLSPSADASFEDMNDWSAVLKVTYGDRSILLTGDASASVVGSLGVGHVDVLKVAHHGSDTGTTPELLSQLAPSVAVIEVGEGNSYGHPTQETLDELAAAGTQTWRTDLDGIVLVTTDGSSLSVASEDTGATQPADPAQVAAQRAEAQRAAEQQRAQEAAAAQAAAEQATDPASQVVYVTNTGEKYHRAGCRYLKSTIETTLGDAVAAGYEPCKVCNPPTL